MKVYIKNQIKYRKIYNNLFLIQMHYKIQIIINSKILIIKLIKKLKIKFRQIIRRWRKTNLNQIVMKQLMKIYKDKKNTTPEAHLEIYKIN